MIVEFDQKKGCCSVKVLAYIEETLEGITTILAEPKEILLENNLQFTLFKGKNGIFLKEYQDWTMEATYIYNNELNDLYATQVYMNSIIKQLEDEITLQVAKKVGEDEIVSKINLTQESIKIIATKLALEGYTTINGGFSIDEEGNASIANGSVLINKEGIRMADGTSIIGGKGILTNMEFIGRGNLTSYRSGNFSLVGFWTNGAAAQNFKTKITIDGYIPENFTITDARVILQHFGMDVKYQGNSLGFAYARALKLYKENSDHIKLELNLNSEFFETANSDCDEIEAGMENGWTPKLAADGEVVTFVTKNIKNELNTGANNRLIIQSSLDIPEFTYENDGIDNIKNIALKSGMVYAILQVYGYMKPKEERENETANEKI